MNECSCHPSKREVPKGPYTYDSDNWFENTLAQLKNRCWENGYAKALEDIKIK